MRIVLSIAAMIIAAAVAAAVAGTAAWHRATDAAVAGLVPGAAGTYSAASLDTLPAPAARYFRRVLRDGQPLVRSAVVTTDAEFFINDAWRPLQATQVFVTSPAGFVWDARISLAPFMPAYVRDSYAAGTGTMTASLLGVYSLVDQSAIPELNAGALQRFLGEAIWLPTALLPSASVVWTARDDLSATVTLTDRGTSVSLLYRIDPDGLMTSISGDRYKESNGTYTLQPWQIHCAEHAERDGMTIPLWCEVAWLDGSRAEPYWRGRITSVSYRYN